MNLSNYYYYFQSALTPRMCDEIIEYGKRHKPEIAVTGGAEKNETNVKNTQAGWNFDWDWSESCQFTRYGVGQYYGWHCDSWDKPYNKPDDINSHGKIRKLSVTISLSEPEDYVGGNLEFDMRNQKDWEQDKKKAIHECTEIRPRGSIIVFPSFVWHRVAPVTKGTRYSLVIWNLGQPWR